MIRYDSRESREGDFEERHVESEIVGDRNNLFDPVLFDPLGEVCPDFLQGLPLCRIEMIDLNGRLFDPFGVFCLDTGSEFGDSRGNGEVLIEGDNGDFKDFAVSGIKPGGFEVDCGKDVHRVFSCVAVSKSRVIFFGRELNIA